MESISKMWRVDLDEHGRLELQDSLGFKHVDVEPVRAFPITEPRRFISLRNREGKELLNIDSLDELPEEERSFIEAGLSKREFMPVILRINRLTCDVPPLAWDVETDRGDTQFLIGSEDNIRRVGPQRLLVVDVHGIRYQIPDYAKLDARSLRLLERVL